MAFFPLSGAEFRPLVRVTAYATVVAALLIFL